MKLSYVAAAVLAFLAPASAQAATYIFNGVCTSSGTSTTAACTSTNGTYGNSVTLNSTTSSSVQVKISAWQMNQSNSAITKAFLGAYTGGFGVTGVNDQNGNNNLHQIDNVGGYTDFLILQFNTAVHLDGVNVNMYGINGVYDSDISFSNGSSIAPATWNANLNPTSYSGAWSNTAGNSSSNYLTDNATGFSKVWLVSASQLTSDRNDGFKLSSITVSTPPAVPEPATWAMMIMGFGLIGASLRRRNAGELLAA